MHNAPYRAEETDKRSGVGRSGQQGQGRLEFRNFLGNAEMQGAANVVVEQAFRVSGAGDAIVFAHRAPGNAVERRALVGCDYGQRPFQLAGLVEG